MTPPPKVRAKETVRRILPENKNFGTTQRLFLKSCQISTKRKPLHKVTMPLHPQEDYDPVGRYSIRKLIELDLTYEYNGDSDGVVNFPCEIPDASYRNCYA